MGHLENLLTAMMVGNVFGILKKNRNILQTSKIVFLNDDMV